MVGYQLHRIGRPLTVFNFPDNPTTGTVATHPTGIQWVWDGVKWVAGSSAPLAALSTVPLIFAFAGKPAVSARLIVPVAFPLTLAANLPGTQIDWNAAPAASVVFTVFKGNTSAADVSLGTIGITAAGAITISTSAVSLNLTDSLVLVAPSTQDTALTDIGFAIPAKRA